MFIMAISAWYLLRGRERDVALRSFAIGSVFGTLAIIGTLQLGDSSAYEVAQVQPVKVNRFCAAAYTRSCWNGQFFQILLKSYPIVRF